MTTVLSSRDAWRARGDARPITPVPAPELGTDDDGKPVEILLKGLSQREHDEYIYGIVGDMPADSTTEQITAEMRKGQKGKTIRDNLRQQAEFIVLCAVDEQGACIFTDEDVPYLMDSGKRFVARIWTKARELSGFDVVSAEDAAKN